MTKILNAILAVSVLLLVCANIARADTPQNPQEAKLLACWAEAAATGQRFTIQEKEALVLACMAR